MSGGEKTIRDIRRAWVVGLPRTGVHYASPKKGAPQGLQENKTWIGPKLARSIYAQAPVFARDRHRLGHPSSASRCRVLDPDAKDSASAEFYRSPPDLNRQHTLYADLVSRSRNLDRLCGVHRLHSQNGAAHKSDGNRGQTSGFHGSSLSILIVDDRDDSRAGLSLIWSTPESAAVYSCNIEPGLTLPFIGHSYPLPAQWHSSLRKRSSAYFAAVGAGIRVPANNAVSQGYTGRRGRKFAAGYRTWFGLRDIRPEFGMASTPRQAIPYGLPKRKNRRYGQKVRRLRCVDTLTDDRGAAS